MISEPEYRVPTEDELLAGVAPLVRKLLDNDAVDQENRDAFAGLVSALEQIVENDLRGQRATHGKLLAAIPAALDARVATAETALAAAVAARAIAQERAGKLRTRVADLDPHGSRT